MTESQGTEFGGALNELRLAARSHLPQLANQYAKAARAAATTRDSEPGPFTRDAYFGDTQGILTAWNDLRNLYENALAGSSANLWDVGIALGLAVDAFAEQDHVAAQTMIDIQGPLETRFEDWKEAEFDEPRLPADPQETPSPMAEEREKRQGN